MKLLAAGSFLILTLLALEAGIRFFFEPPRTNMPLNIVEKDKAYQYRLNPDHPEISRQGLRDRLYEIPKPGGHFRILALGDSVTYGLFVDRESAYPQQLESALREAHPGIEVLNAGVNGYTPYNELHFYRERGRAFQPDLVIAGLCMNDIANPVLHWGDKKGFFRDLPPEAFPDPANQMPEAADYYRALESAGPWQHSALFRFISNAWELYQKRHLRYEKTPDGRRHPVYVTDEGLTTLYPLLDEDSAQWRWLAGVYGSLRKAAEDDGARFVLVFFPLAYQFREGYPHEPQEAFRLVCQREGLICYDPLEWLRTHGGESLFIGRHRYHSRDVWHWTPEGHRVFARGLAAFLREKGLVPLPAEAGAGSKKTGENGQV